MNNLNKNFSKNIKIERDKLLLTQEALSNLCGLHRTYISQLERNLKSPTLNTLETIAKKLKISPLDLLK